MAQIIILLAAMLLIGGLAVLAAPRRAASQAESEEAPIPGEALGEAVRRSALASSGKGTARLHACKRLPRLLTKAVKEDAALPALTMVRENSRSLAAYASSAAQALHAPLRLPRDENGIPRMARLCRVLLRHQETIDAPALREALLCWQEAAPTTLKERETLPLCLQALMTHTLADALDALLFDARESRRGAELAHRLTRTRKPMALLLRTRWSSPACACALLQGLDKTGQSELLGGVEALLNENGTSPAQVTEDFTRRQDLLARRISGVLASFRALAKADWNALTEAHDPIHRALAEDPAGIYHDRMDDQSRAAYRREAARLARVFATGETRVARACAALALDGTNDGLHNHVGYYLLDDEGREQLRRYLEARRGRIWLWCDRRADTLYRIGLGAAATAGGLGFLMARQPLWMLPFFLGVWSALTHFLADRLVRRFRAPRPLPRLHMERIEEADRTLIVIPAVLRNASQAIHMVRRLLIAREACPAGAIDCLLLADYGDSMTLHSSGDTAVTAAGKAAVEAIDSPGARFMYMQRQRIWDADQKTYIGRERKRGALETLNRLIADGECEDVFDLTTVEPTELYRRYTFVLTLDSDTELAPDSLLGLVGTLAHPLNQRQRTSHGMRGVSILQPRMETDPATVQSIISLLEGGKGGVTPYGGGCAGLWQQLCGHSNYEGKGLYRPEALLEGTQGWILPDTVLSHDLLEGELAGCAQSPVETLYDGHPATVDGWMRRLHRWTRGDWQLLPWLLPFVKTPGGVRRNPLSSLSKAKIRDNLRRSMLPLCQLALAFFGVWRRIPGLTLLALLAPELGALLRPDRLTLPRLCARWAMLPYRACQRVDAMLRSLWRQAVGQHRLDWVTSDRAGQGGIGTLGTWSQGLAAAGILFLALWNGRPDATGLVLAALFAIFPLIHHQLDGPVRQPEAMDSAMESSLMDTARATWQFFTETVTQADHFLPPDNLQLQPPRGLARRTSPTNIGLYLLSCLAASELALITPAEAARRISQTADTLEHMPMWHGLPYNWYDTATLAALPPAFISTVDSGNLCACLLCVSQGLRANLPELPVELRGLPARLDRLADSMELDRLFDPAAQLMAVGLNLPEETLTASHYDLYASEALLTCFLAVMRRDVPRKLFARLDRLLTRAPGGKALVSWSGTMFEYMMPTLLLPVCPFTMMDDTVRAVIRTQERHAHLGVYGVSESGYWGFDTQMNYQYHAFGLSALALDDQRSDRVIAPYASALCLPFALHSAQGNLSRLKALGMFGKLGFFESLDVDPAHLPQGVDRATVRSHMAHHQGMILCAVCNALTDRALCRHFLAIPGVEAWSLLLREPTPSAPALPRPLLHPQQRQSYEAPFRRPAQTMQTPVDAHLLGGNGSTMLLSAQGTGAMRAGGVYLTRFTGDPTLREGIQFYLVDEDAVYQPSDPTLPGETVFEEGAVRFHRRCGDTDVTLTAAVEPVQGIFLHTLTLTNRAAQEKQVDVADFLIPALEGSCSGHPAYSELFIETGRPSANTLTATRRPREADESPMTLIHSLHAPDGLVSLAAQTDRMAFLGRNHTPADPAALHAPMGEGLVGAPVTPCLSFRARVRIGGRAQTTLTFATRLEGQAAFRGAPKGEEILALARLHSRVVTEAAGVTQAEAAQLCRLFGMLLWSAQPHQGAATPLTRLPDALREVGLRPERPLLTLAIASPEGRGLVAQCARLCCWMALIGEPVCLCVLVQGDQAAQAVRAAQEVLDASPLRRCPDTCAHVLRSSALPDGLRDTLEAVSRVILYEGTEIDAQIASLTCPLPPRFALPQAEAPALPQEALLFPNGYGGFQEQTGDYVIRLAPGDATPAPWCNLLTAGHFGTLAMESGLNMSWSGNSHLHRLTPWSNDPVCPVPGECLILSEGDDWFSPTPLPLGQGNGCRVQHGPGVTTWQAMGHGLDMSLTAASMPGHDAGLRLLRLRSLTDRPRRIRVTMAARFVLGTGAEEALVHLTKIPGGVIASSPAMAQTGWLCALEGEALVRRMAPSAFWGLWGDAPAMAPAPEDTGSMAVVTLEVALPPRGAATAAFALGAARQADDIERALQAVRQSGASAMIRMTRQRWAGRLQALTIRTPEDSLNLLMNRVLPFQVRASRLEGRCGFYQAGGAIGFRDQLQDMVALILTEPERVRAHLLLCASHQYMEGDVQHWWHPKRTGVRTRISDDKLFLPYMTAWYAARTGDTAILEETVPWLQGEAVPAGRADLYTTPDITQEADTLYIHCLRALTSVALGPRGLPLMGGGDWNDGMNRVDGESVWLGMFYAATLTAFAPLAEAEARENMLSLAAQIRDNLERVGWDGSWYLRAYFPDGTPLGGHESDACRIDSLSQSWAVLAGLNPQRASQGLDEAWRQLYDPRHGLMKLLWPPFDGGRDAGYIGGYLPGVRENGGQYTHAAAWMVWALAEAGQTDRAWELVYALNPIHHSLTRRDADSYRLEPYALAGDVYANPQQEGRGGWSFYTGSAAWLYIIVLEKLLGFEKRGDQVRLHPNVPPAWESFSLSLRHGASTWHFEAARATDRPTLDGAPMADEWITLTDDGRIHQVRVGIAEPGQA